MLNPHTKLRRIMLEEKIMLKRADEKVEVSAEKNRDGIRSIKNALFQKKMRLCLSDFWPQRILTINPRIPLAPFMPWNIKHKKSKQSDQEEDLHSANNPMSTSKEL